MKNYYLGFICFLTAVPVLAQAVNSANQVHQSFYIEMDGCSSGPDTYPYLGSLGPGYGAGIGYGLNLTPTISLVLDLHYNYFPVNLVPGASGGDTQTLWLLINGKFVLVDPANPVLTYLIVGFGNSFYFVSPFRYTQQTQVFPGSFATDPLGRIGLGADIRLRNGFYLTLEYDGIGGLSNVYDYTQDQAAMFAIGLKFDR